MFNAIVIGNLGEDVKVFGYGGNKEGIKLSLAVSTGYGDKKHTEWLDVVRFGRMEKLEQFLLKGVKILVTGPVTFGEYTRKDGQVAKQLSITAQTIEVLTYPDKNEKKAEKTKQVFGSGQPSSPDPEDIDF